MIDFARRLAWPSGPGAFRLWLALVVVLHHFTRVEIGKAPVLVFFALSGYWVHRMWGGRYASARFAYATFLVSRWWRIAPVLVLAGVLTFAVLWSVGDSARLSEARETSWQQIASGVFGLGYAQMNLRPVGPAWSLDVEMQFYLVAPLLVIAVQRLSWAASLLAAFLVQQAALLVAPVVAVTSFLPFFVLGMVAAEQRWSVGTRTATISLSAALMLVGGALVSPWYADVLAPGALHWHDFNILVAAAAMPFALFTVQQPGDRLDAAAGDLSYVVYLLHWPAIEVFRHVAWRTDAEAFAGAVVLVGAVAALSWLTWRTLDRPLQRRRSQWVAAQRSPASAAVREKGADSGPALA